MASSPDDEIEAIIAATRELSKGISFNIEDVKADGSVTVQPESEIQTDKLPWWAALHLKAYAKHFGSQLAPEKPKE